MIPDRDAQNPIGDGSLDDAALRQLLDELACSRGSTADAPSSHAVRPTPDMTEAVMSRLGFVRCTPVEAKWGRLCCAVRRAACVAVAILAAYAGYWMASSREMTPQLAIAPAVGGAVERHSRSLESVFQGMPRLHTPAVVAVVPARMEVPLMPSYPGLFPQSPTREASARFFTLPTDFHSASFGPPAVNPPRFKAPEFIFPDLTLPAFDQDSEQAPLERLAAQVPFPQT